MKFAFFAVFEVAVRNGTFNCFSKTSRIMPSTPCLAYKCFTFLSETYFSASCVRSKATGDPFICLRRLFMYWFTGLEAACKYPTSLSTCRSANASCCLRIEDIACFCRSGLID